MFTPWARHCWVRLVQYPFPWENLRVKFKSWDSDRQKIFKRSQKNSAIDEGVDINSFRKNHVNDLKKDPQVDLKDQLQSHKKLIKEWIDNNGQETQDWREEIGSHLSKLSETLEKYLEGASPPPPPNEKLAQIL